MPGRGEKVNDLALGMSPRVGAACSPHSNTPAGEAGERIFQRSLDSRLVKLQLEAVVVGALVFDPKGYPTKGKLRCLSLFAFMGREFLFLYLNCSCIRPTR